MMHSSLTWQDADSNGCKCDDDDGQRQGAATGCGIADVAKQQGSNWADDKASGKDAPVCVCRYRGAGQGAGIPDRMLM